MWEEGMGGGGELMDWKEEALRNINWDNWNESKGLKFEISVQWFCRYG